VGISTETFCQDCQKANLPHGVTGLTFQFAIEHARGTKELGKNPKGETVWGKGKPSLGRYPIANRPVPMGKEKDSGKVKGVKVSKNHERPLNWIIPGGGERTESL